MILSLLKRKPKVAAPIAPRVPERTVVWAVGDIHGRLDLLRPLAKAIVDDLDASGAERRVVIFLGDFVDRGEESRGVLEHLVELSRRSGVEWRFLKGNHEATMLDFMEDPSVGGQWCEYGGGATLRSYGLQPPDLKHRAESWARLSADLRHKVSDAEMDFLRDLELSVTVGDYFFAHAGARPGLPLDRQSDHDLMWIRRTFLDSDEPFDRVVVHGHTPTAEVHADARRLGIDTKAYGSGILTGLRLEGDRREILQAVCGRSSGASSPEGVTLRRLNLKATAPLQTVA